MVRSECSHWVFALFISMYADLAKLSSSMVVRSPDQSAKVVSSKI